ncbi:CDP-diacylglycerol--serine O-phosphatidyltransferase [candidate division KSB1 bacterium]|nr:CDP-diacylglycerol--serine O-phosphatidyltransferase [candidate division KSB1 bacterium]
MKYTKQIVPSLFTVGNLGFGFWAVTKVLTGSFEAAAFLIIIASICDGLDGKVARYVKGQSQFGVEFDSIVDAISFGLAPAILLYQWYFYQWGKWGVLVCFFYLLCVCYRLARYNVLQTGYPQKRYLGLPTPAAAITLASFVLFNFEYWDQVILDRILLGLMVILALLMVSHVRYDALPKLSFKESKKNVWNLLLLCLAVIAVALYPRKVFFPIMSGYILFGMVRWSVHFIRKRPFEEAEQKKVIP